MYSSTACWPSSDEELLIPKDDGIEPSDDLLQTKMYDWLPPWFKKGNSFFGVRKEVKDRLNKQMRRGVSAQLKQLEEEDLDVSPSDQGQTSARCGGSVLLDGDTDSEGDASREAKKNKIKFYRRFMKQRVETYREDEDETEMEHLPIPMHYEGHYQPGLYDVSGPPLKYFMPWATLGFFVASILMPVLAFTSSHCEGKHEMLAKYPYWWWFPFFIWVAIMMLLEWKCFTYVIVPLIGISGHKRLLSFKASFRWWTRCSILLSLVMHSEVWSRGLLAASAVRASLDCKGWKETLEPAWSKAWNDSMWAGFELGGNLLALAGCGTERHGYIVPVCCMRVWHADALKTLASLNRMVLLLDGQTEYAIKRAHFKLISDPGQAPYDFFHVLKMDMRFMLFDAFFVNLLQNCAKLQFQTSYMALLMYANLDANLDANVTILWTLLSLSLTHVTSLVSVSRKVTEWLKVRNSRMLVRQEFRSRMDVADWREYDKLVFLQRGYAVVLTLQCLFQSFCAIKFCMSQWYCESHLWNVFEGCVQGVSNMEHITQVATTSLAPLDGVNFR